MIGQNIDDPQQALKCEVRNIFLLEDQEGQSYDSCLAVTGSELVQASLTNLGQTMWRCNYTQAISDAFTKLSENKPYQTEIERIDYCVSHLIDAVESDDDAMMGQTEDASYARAQRLHLFAIIKSRKSD